MDRLSPRALTIAISVLTISVMLASDFSFLIVRGQASEMACDGKSECISCRHEDQPFWGISADAMFLSRNNPQSSVLAFNTAVPTQAVDAGDLHYATKTGFDVSLSGRLEANNRMELRFFSLDGWNAQLTTATTPSNLLRFNAAIPIFVSAGDSIVANYTSQIYNTELNLVHCYRDWFELLAGFRYVDLDERGTISLQNATIPFTYSTSTFNRLYGVQLGATVLLLNRSSFLLDIDGKSGVYGNQSEQNGLISTNVNAISSGSDSRVSFVGEIGLRGSIKLTDFLSVRSGYRLLWLDGISESVSQLGSSDFVSSTGLNNSGEVFYHGAIFGIEFVR